eukprot:PLAT3316.7.p1 GENE.PLAT3316.7~~PLAT3316.7.p1  ORF type:complete len:638 (-),score=18.79 PLAT3316.7:108-2021(-)
MRFSVSLLVLVAFALVVAADGLQWYNWKCFSKRWGLGEIKSLGAWDEVLAEMELEAAIYPDVDWEGEGCPSYKDEEQEDEEDEDEDDEERKEGEDDDEDSKSDEGGKVKYLLHATAKPQYLLVKYKLNLESQMEKHCKLRKIDDPIYVERGCGYKDNNQVMCELAGQLYKQPCRKKDRRKYHVPRGYHVGHIFPAASALSEPMLRVADATAVVWQKSKCNVNHTDAEAFARLASLFFGKVEVYVQIELDERNRFMSKSWTTVILPTSDTYMNIEVSETGTVTVDEHYSGGLLNEVVGRRFFVSPTTDGAKYSVPSIGKSLRRLQEVGRGKLCGKDNVMRVFEAMTDGRSATGFSTVLDGWKKVFDGRECAIKGDAFNREAMRLASEAASAVAAERDDRSSAEVAAAAAAAAVSDPVRRDDVSMDIVEGEAAAERDDGDSSEVAAAAAAAAVSDPVRRDDVSMDIVGGDAAAAMDGCDDGCCEDETCSADDSVVIEVQLHVGRTVLVLEDHISDGEQLIVKLNAGDTRKVAAAALARSFEREVLQLNTICAMARVKERDLQAYCTCPSDEEGCPTEEDKERAKGALRQLTASIRENCPEHFLAAVRQHLQECHARLDASLSACDEPPLKRQKTKVESG